MCVFKVMPSSSSDETEDTGTDTDMSDSDSDSENIDIPSTSGCGISGQSQELPQAGEVEEDEEEEVDMEREENEEENMEREENEEENMEREKNEEENMEREENEEENMEREENEEENMEREENEEDDELVKAIKAELNKPRDHPPEINCEDLIIDISFHPSSNILAAASVTGDVLLYKYENNGNELINTLELHVKACRDIEFSTNGDLLYSCGKDKSITVTDMETGKLKKFYDNCHEYPLYCLYEFDDNIICTGDENGTIKVWDIRRNDPVLSFKEVEEFITDMITTDAKKYLVFSSGDGILSAYSMSARKPYVQSEEYDTELTCMQLCKLDSKLVAGSSVGKMFFFNWGEFGYHSDEYLGVKGSINSMISVTENMAVVAYDDGIIRAYNLYPHRHIGIVGQHRSSTEVLDISHDGQLIASCSLDQIIKFWNIRYFEDVHVKKGKSLKKKSLHNNLPSSNVTNTSDFFAGMA